MTLTSTFTPAFTGLFAIMPEILRGDFPGYDLAHYLPNATPEAGDLCFVECEGRKFLGHYTPEASGPCFLRPGYKILAPGFRTIAVLKPYFAPPG